MQLTRKPRIFLNGFPKAGLHLAVLMARSITPDPAIDPPWAGSFGWNSWSNEWLPLSHIMGKLRVLWDGTWLKGHMGYMPEIEQYLYWHGATFGFIYRDFRDVLVSQSYHVTDEDDERFSHRDKDLYRAMDHEERLLACLCGVQQFTGLFDRWALYAPWMNVPWVFKLRYEDMVDKPEQVAREFLNYTWDRTAEGYPEVQASIAINDDYVAYVVENMQHKELSTTFRKGGHGGWREEFTPKVKDEFKKRAGDWLVRLGYEKDDSW